MALNNQTMALFTEENMKKNKIGKKYRMNCKVSGDMIEYDQGDVAGWKHMIRLNELDEVELHEKITINKHKFENIICLKRGTEVKFLKAETRTEMEEWYSLLMKILTKFQWIDAEPESTVEGKKRRVTNPEGMRRRTRVKKPLSAYGSLQDNFNPHEKVQAESSESSTDSSSDESPITSITGGIDQPLYEESIVTQLQQAISTGNEPTYMNVKTPPKPPTRNESIRGTTSKPRVPVESDETQYMDLLPRTKPPGKPSSAATTSGECQATTSDIKSNLEKILQGKLLIAQNPVPSGKTLKPAVVKPVTSSPHHLAGKKPPVDIPVKSEQCAQYANSGVITRGTKSFRLPPSQVKPSIQRKPSLQHRQPVVKEKEFEKESTSLQPQLPKRDGQSLITAVDKFRKSQDEESIIVPLNKEVVTGGKRLCLVQVKDLDYLWIYHWDLNGLPLEEIIHPGDQIISINDIDLEDCEVTFAYDLMAKVKDGKIKLNIRRAPYAQVLHLKKTADKNDIGIEMEGNVIKKVDPNGLFRQAARGKTTGVFSGRGELVEWAITEINMQPVNLNCTTEQICQLLDKADPDVALVIQPADLICAMTNALAHCPMCGRGCHCHD